MMLHLTYTFAQGEGDGGVPAVNVSQVANHSPAYSGNQGEFSLLNYNIASIPASELRAIGIDRHVQPGRDVPKALDTIMTYKDWVGVFFQEDWYKHGERVRDHINTSRYPYKGNHNVSVDYLALLSLVTGNYPTIFDGDGLYRFATKPFYNLKRFKFDDCEGEDCLGKKGFTLAAHEVAPGVFVHIYNIHAEANQNTQSEKIRRDAFLQLIDAINTYSADQAVIVIGDFNTRYARGEHDGLNDFVETSFTGNRQIKDVFYHIQGWEYDRYSSNGDAKTAGEGVEKCFFMCSDRVELIPTLYKDDRDRFGGTPANEGGNGFSDHPPFTITFSYAVNPTCNNYTVMSDDFNSNWGNWEKKNGTEKVERQDDALVIRNNNSGSLIRTEKRWDLSNSQSFYLEYEYKTNGNWDSSDYFDVKYSVDGGDTYQLIEKVQGEQDSYSTRISPVTTETSPDMRFLIESEANNNNEKVYFTDIKIKACGISSAQPVSRVSPEAIEQTGIISIQPEEYSLAIYPNPAKEVLYLDAKDNHESVSWKIIDLFGKEVLSGRDSNSINVSALKSGVYMLSVEKPDGEVETKRLFIE